MSPFEIAMLLCFGKSLVFLYVVLAGYVSGILHKLLYSFDKVIYLYVLNGLMVLTDIVLYYRNRQLARGPHGVDTTPGTAS
jgi:hypothetical protein